MPQTVPARLPNLLLLSAMLAAGALAVLAPSLARAEDDACTTKKFNYKVVEKACKEGGRKAAKENFRKWE